MPHGTVLLVKNFGAQEIPTTRVAEDSNIEQMD